MVDSNESSRQVVIAAIKEDLFSHFKGITNAINEDVFEPVWSILNEPVHKDILTDDFKSELQSVLGTEFNKMWTNSSLENSLNIMELLKQRFRNDPKPKWRPTDQPVSAQVFPIDVRALIHKKKFLKESIEREKFEISNLMEKLDNYRKNCKHINFSRDEVLKEVEEQITVYEEHLEKPNKLSAVALDMLLH